jgi:hypothetical protein
MAQSLQFERNVALGFRTTASIAGGNLILSTPGADAY